MRLHALILLLLAGTATFAQTLITMQVKENTVPCEGVAPMNCLQVKEGTAKTWSNFYASIAGFDYQPGYLYVLKVIKTKAKGEVPADAPAYTYRLKKLVSKKKVPAQNTAYLNQKMILTSLNGKAVKGDKVYLTMDQARNAMSGKSGCNRFNASYKLNGNDISIDLLLGTLMACDKESMELEQEFRSALEKKSFEIHTEGKLVHFKDPQTKAIILSFEIPGEKDIWSFIDGKKWKLIQLDHVAKDYGKAAIQFDVKTKKVTGNGGCNSFFGSYSATGNEISFTALGATKMACLDKDASDTETRLLELLSAATVRFDVAEQTLNFYKNDQLIMMFGLQN